jgi:inorganic pyrophosphatase
MKKGIIFDIDGTLTFDGAPLPTAIDTINQLRKQGFTLQFATNNPGKSQQTLAAELNGMGFSITADEVETSVTACIRYLNRSYANKKGRFLLPKRTQQLFQDFEFVDDPSEVPDYIVLGDLDEQFTYPLLNSVFQQLRSGAQLIVFHMNPFFRNEGKYQLDSGAFTLALEYACEHEAVVTGKPSKTFYDEIQSSMGFEKDELLIVGDDVLTDITGAQNTGIDSVLVKTGKYLASKNQVIPSGTTTITELRELVTLLNS